MTVAIKKLLDQIEEQKRIKEHLQEKIKICNESIHGCFVLLDLACIQEIKYTKRIEVWKVVQYEKVFEDGVVGYPVTLDLVSSECNWKYVEAQKQVLFNALDLGSVYDIIDKLKIDLPSGEEAEVEFEIEWLGNGEAVLKGIKE